MKKHATVALSVTMAALFPAMIFLSFHLNSMSIGLKGPSTLRPGAYGTYYVLVNNKLVHTDLSGNILSVLGTEELGRQGHIVDFYVASDGDLLIGFDSVPALAMYSTEGSLIREYDVSPEPPPEGMPSYFRVATGGGKVFLSDFYDRRLRVFSISGEPLWSLMVPLEDGDADSDEILSPYLPFASVNGLEYRDDLLYLADSMNHRVVVFEEDGTFLRIIPASMKDGQLEGKVPASSTDYKENPYRNPMLVSTDGMELLFLNVSLYYDGSRIVGMDTDGQGRREFQVEAEGMKGLGKDEFMPRGIVAVDGLVLAADREHMVIYSFSREGEFQGNMEDGAMGDLLASLRLRVKFYTWGRYGVLCIMLAFLIILLLEHSRQKKVVSFGRLFEAGQSASEPKWRRTWYRPSEGFVRIAPFAGQLAEGQWFKAAMLGIIFAVFGALFISHCALALARDSVGLLLMPMMNFLSLAIIAWIASAVGLRRLRERKSGLDSGIGLNLRALYYPLVPVLAALTVQLVYEYVMRSSPETVLLVHRALFGALDNVLPLNNASYFAVAGAVNFMFPWGAHTAIMCIMLYAIKRGKGFGLILPGLAGFVLGILAFCMALVFSGSVGGGAFLSLPLIGAVSGLLVTAIAWRLNKVPAIVIPAAIAGAWAGDFLNVQIISTGNLAWLYQMFPKMPEIVGTVARVRNVAVPGYFLSLAIFMVAGVRRSGPREAVMSETPEESPRIVEFSNPE